MEHLRNFLEGMSGILFPTDRRGYPPFQGFEQDARQMRGDWSRVGSDMRTALKKEKVSRQRRSVKNG